MSDYRVTLTKGSKNYSSLSELGETTFKTKLAAIKAIRKWIVKKYNEEK